MVNIVPFIRGVHYVLGYLQRLLQEYVTSPSPLCYKGGIVLVLPVNNARQFEPNLVAKLTSLAERAHLLIGVSNGFTQVSLGTCFLMNLPICCGIVPAVTFHQVDAALYGTE